MYLIRRSDDDSLVKIKDTELAADLGNEGDLVPFYKAGTKYTGYIIFHYANRAELKEKLGQLQAELDASKERKAETPKAAPNLAPSKRKRKPKIIFTPASSKKISKIKPAKLNQATKVKRSNAEKVSTRKIDSSSSSRTESSTDEDKSDLENISQPEAKKLCFKPRHAESEILKEKKIEKTNLSESEDALDEGDLLNTPRKHVAQGQGLESMGRGSQVIRGTSINPSGKKTGSVSTRAPKNAVSEDEDDLFNTPGKRVAQGQGLESMGRGSQVIRGTSINSSGKKTGFVSTRALEYAFSEDEAEIFDNTKNQDLRKDRPAPRMGRASPVYAHSEAKKRQMVPSSESEDIASDDESVRTERNNEVEISVDVTDDEDADDEKQLFGKNWDNGKMKKLKGGIYIKLSIWTRIKYHRNLTPNLLMRNMIEGIFNPEYILNRTFTGKKPTNKDQAIENVQPLHPKAIEVIFETIQQNAKKRGWPLPLDMKDLYRTATQRIGQLKRDYRNRNQGGNN